MGMPRRVFDPATADHPAAVSWQWLTDVSAIGGIVLFASALFFVLVMLFTLVRAARAAGSRSRFADPLETPGTKGAFLDRLGLLTALAVVLIVVAYGYPIWQHLQMPRFGSPGYSPF